jgi:NTP pyrophosphatase (non-canonical NTP hydrolase)
MSINQITRNDVAAFIVEPTLDGYQNVATKSAFYPGQGTPLGLAYCALKLNGEAGELAEHVGKAMRDDELIPYDPGTAVVYLEHAKLTAKRRELIVKEVGDVLWYLSAICNELGIALGEAAATNLTKLHDRTVRNALPGSGDER